MNKNDLKNVDFELLKGDKSFTQSNILSALVLYILLVSNSLFLFSLEIFPAVMIPLFPALGLFFLLDYWSFKTKGFEVEALILNYTMSHSSSSSGTRSTTFKHDIVYRINNEFINSRESAGRSRRFNIGSKVTIYVNPYNFSKFRIKGIFDFFMGGFFIAIGMFIYISFLFN